MRIIFHKRFEKQYKKLPYKIKMKIKERNRIFIESPYDPSLGNHALNGRYTGYRSINVSGNIRIIYKLVSENTAVFSEIGTHSELYR